MADLNEIKAKLTGKTIVNSELKNQKTQTIIPKIDRRKFNGGKGNVGRKMAAKTIIAETFKQWMDQHAKEEVAVTVIDKTTGQAISIKKTRLQYALEKLYEMGTKGAGNAEAIKAWLDRMLGRPAQPIRGEGEDDAPIKLHVDNLDDILDKAYGEFSNRQTATN